MHHPTDVTADRLVNIQEASRLLSMSISTLSRLKRHSDFPKPIALTDRRRAFRLSDLMAWAESKRVAA